MSEEPSGDRDKDVSDNDDRPPPSMAGSVQWDFVRFGLQRRTLGSRLLALDYVMRDKHDGNASN